MDVRATASHFRAALLQTPGLTLPALADFPNGSCGDASELLGQYLRDCGHGEWLLVSAARYDPEYRTHAWLTREDLILDITADQFPEMHAYPVFMQQGSLWHAQWEIDWTASPDIFRMHAFDEVDPAEDYRRLRARADSL
ncbi:hypothetical protein [Sporichthya brevicatena]|uniref:hypothetical protein n=1 Tax=Sporichthya brevicatena TaxID=171442 RepID=UPI0031E2E5B6